jgi:hypothetical protein
MELQNQLILTFLIMFVVLYIFFNMRNLRDGDIFNGSDIKKPLLIALIGTLLFYLYMTWEMEDESVPSYSIANNRLNMNNSNKMNFMNNFMQSDEPSIFLSSRQPFGIGY